MTSRHPLDTTFAKVNCLHEHYQIETVVGSVSGEHWVSARDLVTEAHVYDRLADRLQRQQPNANCRYIGLRLYSSCLWMMSLVGLGSLLLDSRVPDISLENLQLRWNDAGWADRAALIDPRFYALPDDAIADHPHASVVPTNDHLRTVFRSQLEANVNAMLPVFKARSGLGKATLWATAADKVVTLITYAARQMKQPAWCEMEVEPIVHAACSPLRGKADVLWVPYEARQEPFLKRGACCLSYTICDDEDAYCATCPLRPLDERTERLRILLAHQNH